MNLTPALGVAASGGQGVAAVGVEFVAAALLVLIAAFLVSAEVALTLTSRLRSGELTRQEHAGAQRLRTIAADPRRHLNTVMLLRVGCETLAALLFLLGFIGVLGVGWPAVTLSAVLMVVVNYVLVAVAPRILGRQFPESVALASAVVIHPITTVVGPLAQLLVAAGRGLTPRGTGDREGPFTSEAELRYLIDLAEERHLIDSEERQMIHSVFKLDDTVVREVMVPRTDIVFVERDSGVADALSTALRSGFSRIPVAGANVDDLVGVVYLKDLAACLNEERPPVERRQGQRSAASRSRTAGDLMRPAAYVPDSKPIDELLREMQRDRSHVAVVIDEYGGTAGLVTIEDIVEEIVGEITDEYDIEVPPIEPLENGRARVTARLPITELAEYFDVEIDAEEVDTVGGLLAYALERVPVAGATATHAGLRLTAEDSYRRRNQIPTVLVEPVAATPREGSPRE